jgi:hypothetical protein
MSGPRIPKPVRQYKEVLRRILDSRPSGTRQRLAVALGTNRSFVSQFLAAYDAAHPDQRKQSGGSVARRTIQVVVPDMGSERANRLVDDAIRDMARNIILILQEK